MAWVISSHNEYTGTVHYTWIQDSILVKKEENVKNGKGKTSEQFLEFSTKSKCLKVCLSFSL